MTPVTHALALAIQFVGDHSDDYLYQIIAEIVTFADSDAV